VKLVRARFDGAQNMRPKTDGSNKDSPEYIRRHWGEVLIKRGRAGAAIRREV
jgi:hypothetical protein